jgi:hypothetical protein
MVCQMTGRNETEGKITCKLTNDVIIPFFNIKASEMRQISREDKKRGNKMANEGGANALSELRKLSTCHLRLIHSCEEFFKNTTEKKLDGATNAILELYAREEL